jgi:hypothetical protein
MQTNGTTALLLDNTLILLPFTMPMSPTTNVTGYIPLNLAPSAPQGSNGTFSLTTTPSPSIPANTTQTPPPTITTMMFANLSTIARFYPRNMSAFLPPGMEAILPKSNVEAYLLPNMAALVPVNVTAVMMELMGTATSSLPALNTSVVFLMVNMTALFPKPAASTPQEAEARVKEEMGMKVMLLAAGIALVIFTVATFYYYVVVVCYWKRLWGGVSLKKDVVMPMT